MEHHYSKPTLAPATAVTRWADRVGVAVKVRGGKIKTDPDGWQHHAWEVKLTGPDGSMMLDHRAGLAHGFDPPTAHDILSSVLLDAQTLEIDEDSPGELNFDDWADSLGYDRDSRSAEKVWSACRRQTRQLEQILKCAADFYDFIELSADDE